jgi:PAS domain S-box-containing protein
MLEGQEKTAMVYQRDYGSGGNHFVEETASPVRDSEGEIVRAVLVVRDLTDRILIEERLARFL